MKAITKMLGRLDLVTKQDGLAWDKGNWRKRAEGNWGIVSICESERKYLGQRFVSFDLMAEACEEGRRCACVPGMCLTTSYGRIESDEQGGIVVHTDNSIYYFSALNGNEIASYLGARGLTREQFRKMHGEDGTTWTNGPAKTAAGSKTGRGERFWTFSDIAEALGVSAVEVSLACDTVLNYQTVSIAEDGSTLVHACDVPQFKRYFDEQEKERTEHDRSRNPLFLLHCEDDIRQMARVMLSERTDPTNAEEDEADRSFLTALLAFVCEVKGFPGEADDKGDPELYMKVLADLASTDAAPLNLMFVPMLGEGLRYDKETCRFKPNPRFTSRPDGMAVTEWKRFCSFDAAMRAASRKRCGRLVGFFARNEGAVLFDLIMEDSIRSTSK